MDILVFGGATNDLYVPLPDPIHIQTERKGKQAKKWLRIPYSTKVLADGMVLGTGGGAANVAVGLSKLGHSVALAAMIGNDVEGQLVLDNMKRAGVKTDCVKINKKEATGLSVDLTIPGEDRTVIAQRGANNHMDKVKWPLSKMTPRKAIVVMHLSGTSHRMLSQIRKIKKANPELLLAWNPGSTQLTKGLKALQSTLKVTDILNLNEREARELLGRSANRLSYQKVAAKIGEFGPKVVLITRGRVGAYGWSAEEQAYAIPLPTKRLNVTGAGDSFTSGFVAGYLEHGDDIKKGLQYGTANGSYVVTKVGAQHGLLTDKQIKRIARTVKFK
ncbi:carbohydrate kinase family protein [Patescibacteria group bacterium]